MEKYYEAFLEKHRCIICKQSISEDDHFISAHDNSPLSSDKFGCAPVRCDLFHNKCYYETIDGEGILKKIGLY